jgi:hypothetical protein
MPRKKKPVPEAATTENSAATAAAELPAAASTEAPPTERPAWVDGPPVHVDGDPSVPANPQAKNWGNPYKAIVTTVSFEMGENRRFKQRVFTFKEKPADEVLAALKDAGFTYRANEKAWTIPANADTRQLSDELAQQFVGPSAGMSR